MSIRIENLNHIYMKGTPFEKRAIDNVSLEIKDGEFLALIGHTGSGKSTLIQHINGLLKPESGSIFIDGEDITVKKMNLSHIRKKVGLVFQYAEYQLFEETIERDIAFGPRNLGLGDDEINDRVKRAMNIVGLDYETYKDKSPFEVSGGQKRRIAIAGVVAMEPKVLILDEPTAGLDPKGRDDILYQIKELHRQLKLTVILVSHSMEDVAKVADRIIVMDNGKNIIDGKPGEVFREIETLESVGLAVPQVTYLVRRLRDSGFKLSQEVFTVAQAKEEILKSIGSAAR